MGGEILWRVSVAMFEFATVLAAIGLGVFAWTGMAMSHVPSQHFRSYLLRNEAHFQFIGLYFDLNLFLPLHALQVRILARYPFWDGDTSHRLVGYATVISILFMYFS